MMERDEAPRARRAKRKQYATPRLELVGTAADMTGTGRTNPGADAKAGSALSKGH